MKRVWSTLLLASLQFLANAQLKDSIQIAEPLIPQEQFHVKSLLVPAAMIAYGFVALESKGLREFDTDIKEEIREDHPRFHTSIDNYSQYAPALAVYALNAVGIKGKNNFTDRTMIYVVASAIAGTAVQSLKAMTRSPRPDGGHNAFPSGHTATAFVSAEFLMMEYKDVSIWYGIAGYAIAAGTGICRMYNNAHWLRDIIPGAGFGILSTRISYWIYPSIKKLIFSHKNATALILPTYQEGGWGATASYAVQF